MDGAHDFFGAGALVPGAPPPPFVPPSGARAAPTDAAAGEEPARSNGGAANGFADGTQSFQELDISTPAPVCARRLSDPRQPSAVPRLARGAPPPVFPRAARARPAPGGCAAPHLNARAAAPRRSAPARR